MFFLGGDDGDGGDLGKNKRASVMALQIIVTLLFRYKGIELIVAAFTIGGS